MCRWKEINFFRLKNVPQYIYTCARGDTHTHTETDLCVSFSLCVCMKKIPLKGSISLCFITSCTALSARLAEMKKMTALQRAPAETGVQKSGTAQT